MEQMSIETSSAAEIVLMERWPYLITASIRGDSLPAPQLVLEALETQRAKIRSRGSTRPYLRTGLRRLEWLDGSREIAVQIDPHVVDVATLCAMWSGLMERLMPGDQGADNHGTGQRLIQPAAGFAAMPKMP